MHKKKEPQWGECKTIPNQRGSGEIYSLDGGRRMIRDWDKKKVAIYLRRSEGESGSTSAQLERVLPLVEKVEKDGHVAKINRGIRGRGFDKKRGTNFKGKGDIWNEGDARSAFGEIVNRPVLVELLKRLKKGEYEGVIFETMDRLTRDPPELGEAGVVDLYRRQGKHFNSLTEPTLGYEPEERQIEMITNIVLGAGGLSKVGEISKGEEGRLLAPVDRGYLLGGKPEFLGDKSKTHGLDYRKAWNLMQAYGVNEKTGLPNNTTEIAKAMKKTDYSPARQKQIANTKWVRSWFKKMQGWDELGVLDDWLNTVEAINQYVANLGASHRANFKKDEGVKRIISATSGFIGYPAGVNPTQKGEPTEEFITFPNPLTIGLENIAGVEDPTELESWEVKRKPVGAMKLHPSQQQISRKMLKKK